jgi:hypothetical protein
MTSSAALGVNSVGLPYFLSVFKRVGCSEDSLPPQQTTFFETRDRKNVYHYDHKCIPSIKRKRGEAKTNEMKEQAQESAASKRKGDDYGSGMALAIAMGDDGAGPTNTVTTAPTQEAVKKCNRCNGTDHQRITSKLCRYNKGRSLPSSKCLSFRCCDCQDEG